MCTWPYDLCAAKISLGEGLTSRGREDKEEEEEEQEEEEQEEEEASVRGLACHPL